MTEPAFTITVYDSTVGQSDQAEAAALYREIYAEPPYLEEEDDFRGFAEDLPLRARQANFRLVIARVDVKPLGFALGHQLPASTRWWDGALPSFPAEFTVERPGRTFAVIELGVRKFHRQRGLGSLLHAHLTAGLTEERVTLLVRPDAEPAKAAYSRWGYHKIGQVRPYDGAPVYDAMAWSAI